MSNLKISILVPVYNAERYIDRCARSLFEQTYGNLEFVFVNDCTPDGSIDVLKRVLEDYPKRRRQTKIINHEKNRGVAAARNTLVDNATGDYLLWVDADDFIAKNAAEVLTAKVWTTEADMVCFNTAWFTEVDGARMMPENDGSTPADFIQNVLSRRISPVLWGRLMKLELFREHGIRFIEGLNMGEDLMALVEVAYYSRSIANEKAVLYYQEVGNKDSLSRSYSPDGADSTLKILNILEEFFAGKLDVSAELNLRKLEVYIRKLYQCCIDGDKTTFDDLRTKIKELTSIGTKPKDKTPYDFYMFCGNYTLCRIYSLFIKWGKCLCKE